MSEIPPAAELASASRADPELERALTALLRGRDIACPNCGHNMRDGNPRRCSECGTFVVPTLTLSRAVLAQKNQRLVGRDWLLRCFAFAPAAAHLCFGITLGIACVMMLRAGFLPAPEANALLILHVVAGGALGLLAYSYLRLRRAPGAISRLIGFTSGVLLIVLGLLSTMAPVLLDDWGLL